MRNYFDGESHEIVEIVRKEWRNIGNILSENHEKIFQMEITRN